MALLAETHEERVNFLRRIVAIDPTYVRGLVNLADFLAQTGDRSDLLESAELMERAYMAAPTGLRKWNIAGSAVSRFERAGAPTVRQLSGRARGRTTVLITSSWN